MTLMCLFPNPLEASFPQVLLSSDPPPLPNPILESQVLQSFSLFPRMPILALGQLPSLSVITLNPSLLQLACRKACEPISVFHVSRPTEVGRYFPSAISENRELAVLLITMNLFCRATFIPRHILEKDVFQ